MESSKGYAMLVLLLLCVTFAAANKTDTKSTIKCTTCVQVEGLCHNITHVLDFQAQFRKTVVITKLGILHNVLFYAFEPNISDPEYYKVGYVNINARDTQGTLSGPTVTNLRTFDFDKEKNVIYLGGGDGIYISNNGSTPEHFSSRGDTIQSIFFKRHLYFVRTDEKILVEKIGENFKPHEDFRNIRHFVIDFNNHVIFINTTGLYVSKRMDSPSETVHLSKNAFFRGLTTDFGERNTYAWWIDGIYKIIIDKEVFEDSRIVKIADIPEIGAVTFNSRNNILLSSEKGLYRLDPMTNTTKC